MKFPTPLFAVLIFIISFVGQAVSLPVLEDNALEARLEDEVGNPVLITEVDAAVDAEDSTLAAKNGGSKMVKKGKNGKKGKGEKGKKGKGKKKGDKKQKGGKKDDKKQKGGKKGAEGSADNAA